MTTFPFQTFDEFVEANKYVDWRSSRVFSAPPVTEVNRINFVTEADGTTPLKIIPSTILNGGPQTAPIVNIAMTEAVVTGISDFYIPYSFISTRVAGGKGNRNTFNVQLDVHNVGNPTDQLNPLIMLGHLHAGAAGLMFGGNAYCQLDAGVSPNSQGTGFEIDTDIREPTIISKIGLAIADVATSIGHGTVYDTAIMIGNQAGAVGFENGIQFGYNGTDMAGVAASGGLITSVGHNYFQGIDFSRTTFAAFAWKSKGFIIDPLGNVEIGSQNVANTPLFDFHSSGNPVDYDARIYATGGTTDNGGATIFINATDVNLSGPLNTNGSQILVNGIKVIGPRNTGWIAMSGTSDKSVALDPSTATLAQLAARVSALQAALTSHGLLGV